MKFHCAVLTGVPTFHAPFFPSLKDKGERRTSIQEIVDWVTEAVFKKTNQKQCHSAGKKKIKLYDLIDFSSHC